MTPMITQDKSELLAAQPPKLLPQAVWNSSL
jgi:hypothetical protein